MTKELFVYLPCPHEDELLYSVVARYCSQARQRVHKLSCALFGKCFVVLRADLPCSLATLAERTTYSWGLSGEEILRDMTLFPYYAPFLTESTRESRKQALMSGRCKCVVGANAYRVAPPEFLRLCAKCTKIDKQILGETYWRRSHQLPGVHVCPEHGTPLVTTFVRIQPKQTQCIEASSAAVGPVEYIEDSLLPILKKIAVRCKEILTGKKLICARNFTAASYREAALERGITKLPGIFSPKIFSELFLAYYGTPLLAKLGLLCKGRRLTCPSSIFQNNHKQVFHPVEHILVQLFLESLPKVCTAHPFGPGPWTCPNPYAEHDEAFPIKLIRMRSRKDKSCYGQARCSCGLSFTINGVDDENTQIPIVGEIWSFGRSRSIFAQRMLNQGYKSKEVAKILHISVSSLKRLISLKGTKSDLLQKISTARRKWLRLLNQDSRCRVTVARRKQYGLYMFLRKYDKAWLTSQKVRNSFIDWQARDVEWSNLIIRTIKGLGKGVPKTTIVKAAGLNLRIFTLFDRLPLCAQAFKDLAKGATQNDN
ncbi:TnsD family Tn7-like transposition protein [Geomonas edaphica]|uniref:TnsD family Tn7-like transposition protein n=1 Tax=Geomonas edaphica TaxID=2570226 RepID=UPI0010A85F57|nr:TnsD family Tn7-like transposition protein [Geomonas edaphica]